MENGVHVQQITPMPVHGPCSAHAHDMDVGITRSCHGAAYMFCFAISRADMDK